jgi:glutamine synthetase
MASLKQIKEKLKQVDSTKIFFTDLNGRNRSLPVNPANIDSIMNIGIGFDGSSIAGITTVDDSDRLLLPIRDSFRVVKTRNWAFS